MAAEITRIPAVVFAGPSLQAVPAASLLGAELLPPVRRGDIDALVASTHPPAAIGIVDGSFFQGLSVSPREVLRAIDRGITVFGASTMGALRAVECAPYGMIGVGQIYEAYRAGRIDADDEVAVVYDPRTYRPLTDPLIDLRFATDAAVAAGVVPASLAARFLEIARALHIAQRTVPAALRTLTAEVGTAACAPLRRFLAEDAPDTRRDDALALLDTIRAWSPPTGERV